MGFHFLSEPEQTRAPANHHTGRKKKKKQTKTPNNKQDTGREVVVNENIAGLTQKIAIKELLKKEGAKPTYDRRIHAKLIVIDRQIAVISSMNFYSFSTGGSSWEAGMISIDEPIISSVHNTIHQTLKKF